MDHHPTNNQCLGEDGPAAPTYWKPSGRLYDNVTTQPRATVMGEVRITDPTTGGQKGQKLQRFSLIPADFLWALAEHYGKGAQKYEDRNWQKSYKWSLSLDAASRHLNQWLRGEQIDGETGSHHLIATIWHLIALWWFDTNKKGTDDIRG